MVRRYTLREGQILGLIAAGESDKEIASHLSISLHTLRSHVDRLFDRNGLHTRAAAVAGWICDSYGLSIPTEPEGTGRSG